MCGIGFAQAVMEYCKRHFEASTISEPLPFASLAPGRTKISRCIRGSCSTNDQQAVWVDLGIFFCLRFLGSKKWGPQGSTTSTTSAATTSAASTISWVYIVCKLRQHPGRSLFGIGGGCRALGPRRGVGTNGFARLIGGGFRGWFNRLPFIKAGTENVTLWVGY